jgi:hypothetical protein
MRQSFVPSIVPNGKDQTVYLVLNDFGQLGRAYCEAIGPIWKPRSPT